MELHIQHTGVDILEKPVMKATGPSLPLVSWQINHLTALLKHLPMRLPDSPSANLAYHFALLKHASRKLGCDSAWPRR